MFRHFKVVVTPVPELPVNYYNLNDLSKNGLVEKQWYGTVVFYDNSNGHIDIKNDGELNPTYDEGLFKNWTLIGVMVSRVILERMD